LSRDSFKKGAYCKMRDLFGAEFDVPQRILKHAVTVLYAQAVRPSAELISYGRAAM
jgi:hypothetical protein